MLLGAMRVATGDMLRIGCAHSPFQRSYQTYYIQLGLIGTVVGFVVAFSEIELGPDAAEQTQVLLDALGTALWSTLTALLLAYVFGPAIVVVFSGLGRLRTGVALSADPGAAVALLTDEVVRAADALSSLTQSASASVTQLDLKDVSRQLQALDARLTTIATELAAVSRTVDASAHDVHRTREAQMETHARVAVLEHNAAQADARVRGLAGGLRGALSAMDSPSGDPEQSLSGAAGQPR